MVSFTLSVSFSVSLCPTLSIVCLPLVLWDKTPVVTGRQISKPSDNAGVHDGKRLTSDDMPLPQCFLLQIILFGFKWGLLDMILGSVIWDICRNLRKKKTQRFLYSVHAGYDVKAPDFNMLWQHACTRSWQSKSRRKLDLIAATLQADWTVTLCCTGLLFLSGQLEKQIAGSKGTAQGYVGLNVLWGVADSKANSGGNSDYDLSWPT